MNTVNTSGTAGATYSLPLGGSNTFTNTGGIIQANNEGIMPAACTLKNLNVKLVSVGAAYGVTATVSKNGTLTAITCTTGTTAPIVGSTTTCSDTTHTLALANGDTVGYQFTPTTTANSNARILISTYCQ